MKMLREIESQFNGVSAPAPAKWLQPNCNDDSDDLEELRKYRHWQDILKTNPDKRDEIIESRIRKLQRQIDNFKKQLEACEKKNKLK